ncbi:biotin-dependent carboxyltransferase family protein [Chloroflexi bacterium]|nr:biotin-dependent carboxyltransferase family protein [Chloroflexota bacterium]
MIEIIKAGTLTTIQDEGRVGYQELGVPESGALDSFSFKCANLLVGNPENTPVLESVLFGPEIKFSINTYIAVTGGDLGPTINGTKVSLWETIEVTSGSILRFSGPSGNGIRSYLSVSGGFASQATGSVMGSYSTYMPGGFGGYEGRALQDGDVVSTGEGNLNFIGGLSLENAPHFGEDEIIRIIEGPQQDRFAESAIKTLTSNQYEVTPNSDRMGCRLKGPALEHVDGPDVISDGNAFGVIQVPGDGKPIILLSDRGTTGGYTKIATVITADRSKLAQLMPGATINFEVIRQEKAVDLLRDQEKAIASLSGDFSVPLKFRVGGVELDVVSDDGLPLTALNPESTNYSAMVSSGDMDLHVELEISE